MQDERKYKSLPTTIGLNLIAAAVEGGGTVNITHAAVGDGGGEYYVPTPDMTELRGETWRGSIAGKWINEVSPNMIDVKVIIPATVGGFTVREAALFDGDGNMVVVSNIPDVEKAIIENGATGTLTIVIHVLVTHGEVLEFKIDPMLDVMTQADVDREIGKHDKDPKAHSEQIAAAVAKEIKELAGEGELVTDEKAREITEEELSERQIGKVYIIASRERDPSKPSYDDDDPVDESVALNTAAYTGNTELGVVVSGSEYDAENLSENMETAANGSLLIKKLEE